MSALGKLPKVDVAIHADTGWERQGTYELAAKWTPWLEAHGIPVITTSADNATRRDFQRGEASYKGYSPPLFVKGPKGAGVLGRHCTNNWKRYPIKRAISQLLEDRKTKKRPATVEL